ncbi:MAG: nuclear transport factor 2 family protein [Candidatus Cloacimonetes bacterium]|nr:nuclear transport factor 2 family protein [Candidatus Cloacimonadota bacterium]
MKQIICRFIIVIFIAIGGNVKLLSQELSESEKDKIITEINVLFQKSIDAGETLDILKVSENVDDSFKTGFIDNGFYFDSFQEVMNGFEKGVKGINSQKMEIENKRVTVLSDQYVLVTASGKYSTKVDDGRFLSGRFAWTFVYLKIDDKWKIIHSHMSNPQN